MTRLKHEPSNPPEPPERGVKAATFKALLDTAMELIRQDGHIREAGSAGAALSSGAAAVPRAGKRAVARSR